MAMLDWYAVVLKTGEVKLKRYLNDMGDIHEARESSFVARVIGPFAAKDRASAESFVNSWL